MAPNFKHGLFCLRAKGRCTSTALVLQPRPWMRTARLTWRPTFVNRSAIRVGGSPFRTLADIEHACEAMPA